LRYERLIAAALVALIGFLVTPAARAQDSHYWFDQFGNRALLLSGAVVGDPADLSSVYYNPGGLSLTEQAELVLAGLVIGVTGTTLENAVADGGDLKQTQFDVAPSLIAGEIPIEGSKHRFAYSVLQRYGSEFRSLAEADISGADLGQPSVSFVSNRAQLDSALSEFWAGGTWSYPVRDNVGIGISTFFAVRSQRRLASNTVQLLDPDGRAIVANVSTNYDYYNWRVLWKLGAEGEIAQWKIGVAVTTPSVNLFGSGQVGNNLTFVGQIPGPGGSLPAAVASDFQTGRAATFKSPLSVAVGAGRTFGLTKVHVAMEYFTSVPLQTVIDSAPFVGQSDGREYPTAVREALDDVLNVGLGVEQEFSENVHAYFGFHTDFSAAGDNPEANLSSTRWNYYHISGGATLSAVGRRFTLGGNLALGGDELVIDPNDPFAPIGFPPEVPVSSYKLTVLLGFSFLAR